MKPSLADFRRTGNRVLSWCEGFVALVALGAVVAMFFVPPIPQDPAYHRFSDTRTIAGVAHFWNVFSNIGFALAGIYGLARARELSSRSLLPAYLVFCIAMLGVTIGSSFYHHAPSTPALVWDRLPMSIAFLSLFALVLGDRISWKLSSIVLWPMLMLGAASVFYWDWTERHGAGDLRPYALVQFLPMILMPLMLLICPGSRRAASWLWCTFAIYVIAKLSEQFDAAIYDAISFGGHAIKHLLAALAVLLAIPGLVQLRTDHSGGPY